MSIVIDPQLDSRMGCREPYERRQDWLTKAGDAYASHPHRRALWPFEQRGVDDDLPPYLGEAYRDTLHDIHHAAADAATQRNRHDQH